MKNRKPVCDALIQLAGMNERNCISEDIIFQYTEREGLTLSETTRVCKEIAEIGVLIVSQAEYDNAITSTQKSSKPSECQSLISVEDIVSAFSQLTHSDRLLCASKIQNIIGLETDSSSKTNITVFIERINKMKLQYSYIAVLLLSFLKFCNSNGVAPFESTVEAFSSYYRARHLMGEIAEQSDSVLASPDFTNADAKRIILYNPLRRSFLAEYISFDKNNGHLEMSEQLWNNITNEDICEIISVVKSKLDEYYKKIASKSY